jgi:hypothetical protein
MYIGGSTFLTFVMIFLGPGKNSNDSAINLNWGGNKFMMRNLIYGLECYIRRSFALVLLHLILQGRLVLFSVSANL